jgi:hypothetical protein
MPYSGYPFAAKVGQFKPPNWTNLEYRNQRRLLSAHQPVGSVVEELWTKYIQLTEAEVIFRTLKSELSIRTCSINWSLG